MTIAAEFPDVETVPVLSRRQALKGAVAAGLLPGATRAASDLEVPPGTLSNPKASLEARALYRYLWSIYGKHTLTGQQEQNFTEAGSRVELNYLQQVTGRQPALLGLDYIEPRDQAGVNERAAAWHRSGGIVTLCWHWGAPDVGTGYENSKHDFDVGRALMPGTPQNQVLGRQMAHVADLLTVLRNQRVPVLWRPFHEFSGDWFWWGKHGPEALKALWRLMYEYFTRSRGLDNLIWVLGWAGQNVDAAYYPGRSYVDVAGADIYADDHGALAPMFSQVKGIVRGTVPICLHENGPVPDPAKLGAKADWLWFMTWHTRWLTDPRQNTSEELKSFYSSQRFITKDELPLIGDEFPKRGA